MTDQTDQLTAKGREIQRQLWGDAAADADRPALPAAELAPDYFAMVRQFCFGMFWSRPNLSVRDRSLITVAMLAALGRQEELAGHLRGARNVGITEEQLVEVLMQAGVYAGVPVGVNALTTAAAVLRGA
ncbi:MAG TPA: carboxymuconolactone decarboxylase family protein [Acidimicrobiales bacterium]|nr:carboxymuconolactone decarboxylase family protein [Acidimicrobiales bacterium]